MTHHQHRAVLFHRASAPYEAGDIAGFPHAQAQRLVTAGVAAFYPPVVVVDDVGAGFEAVATLAGMTREQLVAFAREHLGVVDEPPAEVTDDELRQAILAQADPALFQLQPEEAEEQTPAATETPAALVGKGGKKAA